jgi:hypothetical protein
MGSAIADLWSKLEKVALGEEKTGSLFLVQSSSNRGRMVTASYNFGTSLKEPWKPIDLTISSCHIQTQSYPAAAKPI